jgi:enterobactin synthetase component D / holo-[acyl-carrier protein] synthase
VFTDSQLSNNPATLSSVLGNLFPAGAVVAELRQPGDARLLYPAEAESLGRSVPKRVGEFAAGRLCARRALAEFGIGNFVLRVGERREPLWPEHMIGSITHTAGLCAAVVAERRHLAAVGLDSEVVGQVPEEIWPAICLPEETAWLATLPDFKRAAAVTLIFSAKEAFYKCQYPLAREWLDFHDVKVEVLDQGAAKGEFRIHATRRIALADRAELPLVGRYEFHEEFVSVGIVVGPEAS